MATLFARARVADFDQWRAAHDSYAETRQAFGESAWGVHTLVDDPLDITVWQVFPDADSIRAFLAADTTGDVIANAGIVGQPDFWITDDR